MPLRGHGGGGERSRAMGFADAYKELRQASWLWPVTSSPKLASHGTTRLSVVRALDGVWPQVAQGLPFGVRRWRPRRVVRVVGCVLRIERWPRRVPSVEFYTSRCVDLPRRQL